MSAMTSQFTSHLIVCSTTCLGSQQRNIKAPHYSTFVKDTHQSLVNSSRVRIVENVSMSSHQKILFAICRRICKHRKNISHMKISKRWSMQSFETLNEQQNVTISCFHEFIFLHLTHWAWGCHFPENMFKYILLNECSIVYFKFHLTSFLRMLLIVSISA